MMIKPEDITMSDVLDSIEIRKAVNAMPLPEFAKLIETHTNSTIEPRIMGEFKYCGLNNIDFWQTGFWKTGFET
jgi:hypothetical protein